MPLPQIHHLLLLVGQLVSVLTSLPPLPPAPSTPTAFAFFWPCHIPKRIRCLGKLAALRSPG